MGSKAADIKNLLMPIRQDWNRRGPPIPRWFRDKLRQIDKTLFLQYLPAADPTELDQGVDRSRYPNGLWAICRRLRRTNFLLKRWVYCVTDLNTGQHRPSYAVLRMVKLARNAARNSGMAQLERDIDKAVYNVVTCPNKNLERTYWCNQVADTCRKHGITQNKILGRPVVSMHGAYAGR